jgi:pyruvate ferredoxin oxidoreductase gamma subunit
MTGRAPIVTFMAGSGVQVRIHGRGGQGVVTAAELLSVAAFLEGRHAQAFPSFGSERTGAPVMSFCRISDLPIRTREPIAEPDVLIVQDATLLHQPDLFNGLRPHGYVLINSSRAPAELALDGLPAGFPADHIKTVPATEMAIERVGKPLPNTILLGGFAALTGAVSLASVLDAIKQRFSGPVAAGNALAASDAFEYVSSRMEDYAFAPPD